MGTNYYHEPPKGKLPRGSYEDDLSDADIQRVAATLVPMYDEGSEVRWVLERVAALGVQAPERIHIGKSSVGWKFLFHASDKVQSFEDVKRLLAAGGRLVDEYGKEHAVDEFVRMVEFKARLVDCVDQLEADPFNADKYRDGEGHVFYRREFS
jgi:hypothetical protein